MESEQTFNSKGVSACAVCDGFFFKGQDVAVVGAGDTAAEEATYLSKICNKLIASWYSSKISFDWLKSNNSIISSRFFSLNL